MYEDLNEVSSEAFGIFALTFLRLARVSSEQIILGQNETWVMRNADEHFDSKIHDDAIKWSGHEVGVAVLFNLFHGFELTLKTLIIEMRITKCNRKSLKIHSLDRLILIIRKVNSEDHRINKIVGVVDSFLKHKIILKLFEDQKSKNQQQVNIDDWHHLFKYPTKDFLSYYSHFVVKWEKGTDFWKDVYDTADQLIDLLLGRESSLAGC